MYKNALFNTQINYVMMYSSADKLDDVSNQGTLAQTLRVCQRE